MYFHLLLNHHYYCNNETIISYHNLILPIIYLSNLKMTTAQKQAI